MNVTMKPEKIPMRLGDNTMRSTKLLMLAVLIMITGLVIPALAAEEPTESAKPLKVAGKPADAEYPFVAQVTGTDIYVRSGNSTADYPCTKISTPDTVTVVDEVFGWARILPPVGCYSWVYKAYVKLDPSDPTIGVITGNNVNVWAGAEKIEAGRSSGSQTQLNTGEVVTLFAKQPETSEYYKIEPPTGAHLWVSVDYLKYVSQVIQDKPIVIPPRPDKMVTDAAAQPSGEQPRPKFTNLDTAVPDQTQPAVKVEIKEDVKTPEPEKVEVPKLTVKENELMQECYKIEAGIDEELKKSINLQNYTKAKESLDKVKDQPDAGKAGIYAQYLLDRIQRYELAHDVTEALKTQDAQLEKAKANIEKAHQDKLKKMPKEVNFLYVGTLKPSHVYTSKTGQKRYILIDATGKILCYIISASPQIDAQLQQKLNATVGINGEVVSDVKSLVALVAATEIESMQ